MGRGSEQQARWDHAAAKAKDTGFPIRSGMTERRAQEGNRRRPKTLPSRDPGYGPTNTTPPPVRQRAAPLAPRLPLKGGVMEEGKRELTVDSGRAIVPRWPRPFACARRSPSPDRGRSCPRRSIWLGDGRSTGR